MFKKLKLFFLSLLSLFSTLIFSCKEKHNIIPTVPFTLKKDLDIYTKTSEEETLNLQGYATLIKSKEEFDNYVSDEKYFEEELSDEFKEINSQYDETYFESNDLIAYIKWSGHTTYGYELNSLDQKKTKRYWLLSLLVLKERRGCTSVENGTFFCYYFEVIKTDYLDNVKVEFEYKDSKEFCWY